MKGKVNELEKLKEEKGNLERKLENEEARHQQEMDDYVKKANKEYNDMLAEKLNKEEELQSEISRLRALQEVRLSSFPDALFLG